MKNKFSSVTTNALILATGMVVSAALADNSAVTGSIQTQLSAAAAPELPAQAAKIIAGASADALQSTVDSVISAVVSSRPVTTISVVSAIAQQNAKAAPMAAGEAAKLQPRQAAWIARAAAVSAPSQAGNIVFAVCQAVPSSYAVVATAVSQAVPDATKEILNAVSEAIPSLKSYVDQASATYQGSSVGIVLAEVERLVGFSAQGNASSTPLLSMAASTPGAATVSIPLPPPKLGPPITPPPTSPTEVSYTNSVPVPPNGGRDYSGG